MPLHLGLRVYFRLIIREWNLLDALTRVGCNRVQNFTYTNSFPFDKCAHEQERSLVGFDLKINLQKNLFEINGIQVGHI